jgi:translin
MALVNFETAVAEAERELDERDEVREIAIRKSREIVRASSDLIFKLHKQPQAKEVVEGFRQLKTSVMELETLLAGNWEVYYSGFVEEALQEYVEASLFRCVMTGREIPTHVQMKVDASVYILGLGDLIGELRRAALNCMIAGRTAMAERLVSDMEILFLAISRLHYPSKLAQIRKKQDTARAMLDRTLGELSTAIASRAAKRGGQRRRTAAGGKR